MSEPTKGPYVARDVYGDSYWVEADGDHGGTKRIAWLGWSSSIPMGENTANAHLLAASWDMREALQKHHELLIAVVSAIRVESIKEQLPFGLYDQAHSAAIEDGNGARAALAKSRGEAQ